MDAAIFDRLQALANAIKYEWYKPDKEDHDFINKHGRWHMEHLSDMKKITEWAKKNGHTNILTKDLIKGHYEKVSSSELFDVMDKARDIKKNRNNKSKAAPKSRLSRIMNHKGKIGAGLATVGIAAFLMNRNKDKGE